MTPESLQELRRQRAAVQQHLDWLDAQIRAADGATPAAHPAAGPAPVVPASESLPPDMPVYEPDPVGAGLEARRGCFLYAAVILALLGAALAAIYYWRYRDHPLFLAPRPAAQVAPAGRTAA